MNKKSAWGKGILFIFVIFYLGVYTVFAQGKDSYQEQVNQSFAELHDMVTAARKSGAVISTIQSRVKLEKQFQSEREYGSWKQQLMSRFSIARFEPVATAPDVFHAVGEYKGINVSFYLDTNPIEETKGKKIGLSVDVTGKDDQVAAIQQVTKVLKQNEINGSHVLQINTCVRGFYSGKLKNDLQKAKSKEIVSYFNGNIVEALEDNTVLSYSAYSPQIKTQIYTNHNKMNLQVATHYDELDQKTLVTIGIPIITMEY
ncbi:YwmB family TATA-box binding protein [Aneurinibacillus terranovensis]|uniref:YwmB family TATA-box binding protein n=1 Tax=Aneurinibacillus terranovensis TaxID=278991 RepID=UPI00040F9EB4|nr:YwmB family TATA-box binding protein [Aneurinibacillus terranovensis]